MRFEKEVGESLTYKFAQATCLLYNNYLENARGKFKKIKKICKSFKLTVKWRRRKGFVCANMSKITRQ